MLESIEAGQLPCTLQLDFQNADEIVDPPAFFVYSRYHSGGDFSKTIGKQLEQEM